jgi:hypothetical protein
VKALSVTVFLGVLLSLPIIYYLSPLNGGAIALVIFLTVGVVSAIGEAIKLVWKPRGGGES